MTKVSPLQRFFSVADVADALGVSTRSVHRWIDTGVLLAHRFGRALRIAESDLNRFLADHR